jgi:hypothetical protein
MTIGKSDFLVLGLDAVNASSKLKRVLIYVGWKRMPKALIPPLSWNIL